MIHPDTQLQFIDDEVGYGVVATRKIPMGTITWAHDKFDKVFTPEEVHSLEPIYQEIIKKFSFRNQTGNPVLCWDFGRFVNHSFNANCMSTAYNLEIAIRDINVGEELTDDYGFLNISVPFQPKDEHVDRKWVYPDDIARYHQQWDQMIMNVLPFINTVEQPLEMLLSQETLDELNEVARGKKKLRSILETYFHDPVFVMTAI